MKEGKQREMAVSCHVLDVLRTVEVLKHVAMKRVLCPGRWQDVSGSECGDPRPTPVEFLNPRHGDNFFASSDEIKAITRELITIVWDDTAASNTKAEDAKRVSAGFITGRLRVYKLKIRKLGDGGQLDATPCSRAGVERAHLGPLSQDPTLATVILRKSQNKESVSSKTRIEILTNV